MARSNLIRIVAIGSVVLGFLGFLSPATMFAAAFGNAQGSSLRVVTDSAGNPHNLITITMDDGTVQTVRVGLFLAVDRSAYKLDLESRLDVIMPHTECGVFYCSNYTGTAISSSGVKYTIGLNEE